jgi:signal transduction histidine kinase
MPADARPPDAPADPIGPSTADQPSPLLTAALALVGQSATPAELERRFTEAGAVPQPGVAQALLADLASRGLVRPARQGGRETRFVPTSLGVRVAEAGLDGSTGVALEDLEQLRTDLLSTISHELRTPLTAVRTSVGLLLDPETEPTAEQERALLESIERNADRMQRLIGDILELSRFRAGRVSLQFRSFGARALAQAAIAVVEPLATKHGQQILLNGGTVEGHSVYGDRRRLEQALLNLVSNAQRYSPDGAEVRVRLERRGSLTAWVVEDDGPGIPEADMARLFERFFVGRNDLSGPGGGVGLGLPTALAIAQAHGGTIEVVSEAGRGSVFALVVPTDGPESEP